MSIDWKYILKRVIIGVLIALILMLFKRQLLLVANAQTLSPSTSCVILSGSSDNCAAPPVAASRPMTSSDTGLGFNVWFQDSTLLETGGSYFIEFRALVLGNGQTSPRSSFRLFTGNNGTAGSSATPDRDETFAFYQVTENTYQIVWSFGIDSFSNFNTLRFSWFSDMQSFNGMIGGLQSATLSITSGSTGNDSSSDTSNIINNQNQNSQNIINNQNNNTQNIINNSNSNTQDLIDNQNENTDKIIESLKDCKILDDKVSYQTGTLYPSGSFSTSGGSRVSDFIDIHGYQMITIKKASSGDNRACFYNSNKAFISCFVSSDITVDEPINIPNGAYYFRFTFRSNANEPNYKICKNGYDIVNDTLTDDSINSDTGNDFFDNFNYGETTLSSVITAPLRFFNKLSDTCQPLTFTWLNTNIVIPCGDTIFWNRPDVQSFRTFWNILFGGVILYGLALRLFKVVNNAIDPTLDVVESVGVN